MKTRENKEDEVTLREVQLYSDSLVVCEAKRGEVGVFLRKVCQSVNDSGQLWGKQQRGFSSRLLHNTPLLPMCNPHINTFISGLYSK